MEIEYTKEMVFLHDLARRAGDVLLSHFGNDVGVRQKADRTLVTDADLASEKLILETLRLERSDDKVFSEEAGLSSDDRSPGSSIWIVDPLDGTTNFANNYPFFCVSIARGEFDAAGRIRLMSGAVHDPIRNKTYVAQRGRGSYVNHKRIRVCQDRNPQDAFLVTGFAYHRGENLRKDIEFFLSVAQTCQSIRRDGAAALDLALVAEGVYDGYWEAGLRPWDIAAGALLVEEAGGVIRNFMHGAESRYDLEVGDIICGTPSVVQLIAGLI